MTTGMTTGMTRGELHGRHILIVEDEYLLADDLRETLEAAGATVLGPAPNVRDATRLIESADRIDAAVLDINLRGELVFPVADLLRARAVPFAFATGYDRWAIPERFVDAPRIEKPLQGRGALEFLRTLTALSA